MVLATALQAQRSTLEPPYYDSGMERMSNYSVRLEAPDIEALRSSEEIQIDQYGTATAVNLNTQNSGQWQTLENGDRVWLLEIESPGALSLNLTYDKFYMSKGSRMHVFSPDRKAVLGAFTHMNNLRRDGRPSKFATSLIPGDRIVIQLYESALSEDESVIQVSYVIHGFECSPILNTFYSEEEQEDLGCFGSSGSCQVNVNCPEGNNWQAEKTGVASVITGNGKCWLTGSLLTNTSHDGTPYFLTAEHGLYGSGGNLTVGDTAVWTFHWNWESSGCSNGSNFTPPSTFGAILVATWPNTDMALFRLCERPTSLGLDVYYNGWDHTTNTVAGGVMLHHPRGDIKKIATYSVTPSSFSTNEWLVSSLDATTNGHSVPQGGSSGAPVFNANHHIIGNHWRSSSADCSNPLAEFSRSGKVSRSWNSGSSASDRLRDWLDPDGISTGSLNGEWFYGCESQLVVSSGNTVNLDNTGTANCFECDEVDILVAGTLNVSNQTMYLLNGSSLEITSTGVVNITGSLCLDEDTDITIASGGKLYINGIDYSLILPSVDDITFNNQNISGTHRALNSIEATGTVQTIGNTTLIAGRDISLKPGFSATPEFVASIDVNINECEPDLCHDFNKTEVAQYEASEESFGEFRYEMSVYPNPANQGRFTLKLNAPEQSGYEEVNFQVFITDLQGRRVGQAQMLSTMQELAFPDLSQGVYSITVIDQYSNIVGNSLIVM